MAIGQKYSYGTDSPIAKDYVGNALANVEDNAFKYRAEQRLAEEKKAKDEEKQLEELSAWNKSAKADITGYGNVDVPIRDYLMQLKERGSTITNQLRNPNLSFQEKVKLSAERDGLVGSMDYVKQYPTMVNEMSKEILDGVKAGKYDTEAETLAIKTLGAIKAGDFKIDASTGTPKVSIWERDANGNPTKVLAYQQNFGDFLKNNLQPDLKSTYKDEVAKYHKEYQPDSIKTKDANGRLIFTKKVDMTPGSKDYANAEEKAIALLSAPHEMKKVARLANLPISDTEGIIKYAVNDLLKGVPSQTEDLQDPDVAIARQREARENRKAKKEEEETTPVIGTGTITSKEGVVEGTNYKIDKGSKTFAISKAQRKLGDGKIQSLKEVRVLPDGKLAFVTEETYETEGKTSSRLTPQGEKRIKDWLAKNPTKTEADIPKEGFYQYGDAENINVKSTKPKIKVYDTGKNADDAEGLAIMLVNPETGEKFSGLNEATNFFKERAGGITSATKQVISRSQIAEKAKSSEYTNITETNKGTIGVKDGKWYDIKTGKPIQ